MSAINPAGGRCRARSCCNVGFVVPSPAFVSSFRPQCLLLSEKSSPVSAASATPSSPHHTQAPLKVFTPTPRCRNYRDYGLTFSSAAGRTCQVNGMFLVASLSLMWASCTNPNQSVAATGLRCIQNGSLAIPDRRKTASDRRLRIKTSAATKLMPVHAAFV